MTALPARLSVAAALLLVACDGSSLPVTMPDGMPGPGRAPLCHTPATAGPLAVTFRPVGGQKGCYGFSGAFVTFADVNGDGLLDLPGVAWDPFAAGGAAISASPCLGDGQGAFIARKFSRSAPAEDPSGATVADLNEDGKPDVVIVVQGDPDYDARPLMGVANGDLIAQPTIAVPQLTRAPTTADVNHDGHADIIAASADGLLRILLGDGKGGLAAQPDVVLDGLPFVAMPGDFDGDGLVDLAVYRGEKGAACDGVDTVAFYWGGPAGLEAGDVIATGACGIAPAVADFDDDGLVDLVVAGGGQLRVVTGARDRHPRLGAVFATGRPVEQIAAADFDGDGCVDVALVHRGTSEGPAGPIVLLRGVQGGFTAPVEIPTANANMAVGAGDFNNDGRPDLALITYDATGAWLHPYLNLPR